VNSKRDFRFATRNDAVHASPSFPEQSRSSQRAIRHVESLREAGFYIINNPVRANLVRHWRDYPLLYLNSTIAAEAAPTEFPPGQSE
jgi:hypothetical protein